MVSDSTLWVLKIRQQDQNGVTYAKSKSSNQDLITVSALPEM